jgi:gliding motility-associated-like protein
MYPRILQCLFLVLISLQTFAHDPGQGSTFRFIENKNQWDSKIRYRADIQSGALFLEKNCFTYHLIDGKFLELVHLPKVPVDTDTLKIRGHAYKVNFENSNPEVVVNAEGAYPDYNNYFVGKDRSKWASNARAFRTVNYQNLYDGVDLKIYSRGNSLKYDFIVLPNVDPAMIQLKYDGVTSLRLKNGDLVLETSLGNVTEQRPFAYQNIAGKMIAVPCDYVLDGNKVAFTFPSGYNRNYKLIIDPVLIFSTYSGSTADNFGYTACPDSHGFLYSGSTAFGTGYPFTLGAYQTNYRGGDPNYLGTDIGITKYDTTGTKRIYSTYLGGNGDEMPHSLIVNADDELFIFGTTGSSNFPTTFNAFDLTFAGGSDVVLPGLGIRFSNGSDIFVTKLSNDGATLLASTYLGGTANDGLNLSASLRYNYADEVRGEVDVDKNGNVYVVTCTQSTDFPIVGSTFQQTSGGGLLDACVIKLTNDLSAIQWSSYLGGEDADAAYSLAIDDSSHIYVAGGTRSLAFPSTAGVLYPSFQGLRSDGFITHINKDGQSMIHSTYYGSSTYDQIYFVELDQFNNVHVFGQTSATGLAASRFIQNAAFSQPNSGQFISKLTPELDSVMWSTVFGTGSGRPNISPTAFLVDLCSKIYLSGWGGTPENTEFIDAIYGGIAPHPYNMLTTLGPNPPGDFFQSTTDLFDFYLFVIEGDASAVHYASFFGGNRAPEHVDGGTSRFDRKGKIYQAMCAGCGGHSDMPIKPPFGPTELPERNNSGECNLGVFKMDFRLPIVVADFDASPSCIGETVQFTNKSQIKSATTYKWLFGDGDSSNVKDPTHIYTKGRNYKVALILSDKATCNLADTIIKIIYISDLGNLVIDATADQYTVYKGKSTTLHASPNSGYNYLWSPSSSLSDATSPNPVATPPVTTTYKLTVSDPLVTRCGLVDSVTINVIEIFCIEPYIFVPNAFSPNGDGDNDSLFVRGNDIREMFFTVYNRWGEKVFETKDKSIGWDGKFKDMKADPGVFVYYLEVTCVDDQKFFKKGNVTLIR